MHQQKNLLLSQLRGPVHLESSTEKQYPKYIRYNNKCDKCFRATPVDHLKNNETYHFTKNRSYDNGYGNNINNEKSIPPIEWEVQSLQVSKLKKMVNENSKQIREKIIRNNPRLAQRLLQDFRSQSSTGRSNNKSFATNNAMTNRSKNGRANNNKFKKDISFDEESQLAQTALLNVQNRNRDKDNLSWIEFAQNFPQQVNSVSVPQNTVLKRKTLKNVTSNTTVSNLLTRRQTHRSIFIDPNNLSQQSECYAMIIKENVIEQPFVVLDFVLMGQKFCPNEASILQKWIHTLEQETRMEIERDKKFFPIPRNINQTSIRKGLDELFGTGKLRRLRPGEEALIMETINLYLQECLVNGQLLTSSIQMTIQHLLKKAGLEELNDSSTCMSQVECHWKIMATQFKYSGNPALTLKNYEKSLITAQSRGHFLDLSKVGNKLVAFLLRNQISYNSSD